MLKSRTENDRRMAPRVFVKPLISQQGAGVDMQPDESGIGLFAGAHERLYESSADELSVRRPTL